MPARKHVARERIAEGKYLYEDPPTAPAEAASEPRAALYARVYKAAQTQMDKIELVQKTLQPTQAGQSERTVRILATLNKTLLEIAALTKPDEGAPPDEADDDAIPRDMDEFRQELARRLRALIDQKSGAAGMGADASSAEPEFRRG